MARIVLRIAVDAEFEPRETGVAAEVGGARLHADAVLRVEEVDHLPRVRPEVEVGGEGSVVIQADAA